MDRYYEFAETRLKIQDHFTYTPDLAYEKFAVDPCSVDYTIKYQAVTSFPSEWIQGDLLYECPSFKIIDRDHTEYRLFYDQGVCYALGFLAESKGWVYYLQGGSLEQRIQSSVAHFNYMMFEKIMMQFRCVILHASMIRYKNKMILFAGPSGVGKSTQAELWKRYTGSWIINGDRALLKKKNGLWYGFGLPMNGSSAICENNAGEIQAIILLEKGKENQAVRLRPGETLSRLYGEITVNRWNEVFVRQVLDMTVSIALEVPVYLYRCSKSEEAVSVLEKVLREKRPDGNLC